jgi:hypothetical protein
LKEASVNRKLKKEEIMKTIVKDVMTKFSTKQLKMIPIKKEYT